MTKESKRQQPTKKDKSSKMIDGQLVPVGSDDSGQDDTVWSYPVRFGDGRVVQETDL